MTHWRGESAIGSRLRPRQVALLAHLDECRSVVKAAEAAGMTQPAASKLLRDLEQTLGVKLFDRHARGVVPTWFGEILVRHARSIMSEFRLAQEEITALKHGLSGQVAIGTVLSPGTQLIPLAVTLIKRRCPGLTVAVHLDHSRPLVSKLLQGQLDILICRVLDSHRSDELEFERLVDEQHGIVAGASHPLAGRTDLSITDLMEQPWILPTLGSVFRDRLTAVLLEQGLHVPANVVETESLPVITGLLRSGEMIAPVPLQMVEPLCRLGELTVLINDLCIDIGCFGIVTRRGRSLAPGAKLLLSALRDSAATLYSIATPQAAANTVRARRTNGAASLSAQKSF